MSQVIFNSVWKPSTRASTIRPQILNFRPYSSRGLSTPALQVCPINRVHNKQIRLASPTPRPISQALSLKSSGAPTRKMSSTTPITDRYKLVFFVPPSDLEACKEAIFATGAGSFPGGKYTKCCFQTNGTGQFLPSLDANPAIGSVGALEKCDEVKAEIMCLGREVMLNAVQALIKAHPYEEVAYEVYRMENV